MKKKIALLNQLVQAYQSKSTPAYAKSGLLSKIHSLIKTFLSSGNETLKKAAIAAMLVLGSMVGNAQFFANPVKPFYGAVGIGEMAAPVLVDLDNDGDLDILVGGYYGSFNYYENTGTANNPSYGSPVNSPFGLDSIPSFLVYPTFADMDNDGDLDLFTNADYYQYGSIFYYENTGTATSPNFANPVTNPFGMTSTGNDVYITFPETGDIDGDGDIDLLVGVYDSNYAKMFVYYENTGTQQNPVFGNGLNDPFGLLGQMSRLGIPRLVDIDNDGDLDLFAGGEINYATYEGGLAYFENTGTTFSPSFGTRVDSPFGITDTASYIAFPAFGDVDNDGDADMLVGDYNSYGSSIYYYENVGVDAINEQEVLAIKVYPNPTTEWVNIALTSPYNTIEITDLSGKLILRERIQSAVFKKNLSAYPKGIYFIKVFGEKESKTIKLVKE